MMNLVFCDEMVLDEQPRRTADGYLVATPRVARVGIQEYLGVEVGRPDMDVVRVYRPEDEVFSDAAMKSMAHRPITIDHPMEAVTASNWKRYARGQVGGEIARDGDFLRVPMVLMDQDAINTVLGGKAQISNGYSADLEWTPGVTSSGEQYDAIQRNIRGNHIAIVDSARGGSMLRVYDAQPQRKETAMTKSIVLDGITVEVSDTAAQVIDKMTNQHKSEVATLNDSLAKANTKLAETETALATAQTEKAALETKLQDSTITPEKLDAAVAERAKVIDSAKAVLPTVVVDGKSVQDIRRDVVNARLGDTAKDWNDAQVTASFAALTATATPAQGAPPRQYQTLATSANDSNKAYLAMCERLSTAHNDKKEA